MVNVLEMKILTRQFIHQLYLVIQGSVHAYLAITEKLPEQEKQIAWDEYNESFDRQLMPQLIEVLERNKCGVAELCHATLKLMDLGARMVEEIEAEETDARQEEEQALKTWFVPVH